MARLVQAPGAVADNRHRWRTTGATLRGERELQARVGGEGGSPARRGRLPPGAQAHPRRVPPGPAQQARHLRRPSRAPPGRPRRRPRANRSEMPHLRGARPHPRSFAFGARLPAHGRLRRHPQGDDQTLPAAATSPPATSSRCAPSAPGTTSFGPSPWVAAAPAPAEGARAARRRRPARLRPTSPRPSVDGPGGAGPQAAVSRALPDRFAAGPKVSRSAVNRYLRAARGPASGRGDVPLVVFDPRAPACSAVSEPPWPAVRPLAGRVRLLPAGVPTTPATPPV